VEKSTKQNMENRRNFMKKTALASVALFTGGVHGWSNDVPDVVVNDIKALAYQQGSDRAMYVRIETNDGTVGWGECSPNGISVIQTLVRDLLAPEVIGKSPFDTEKIWQQIFWKYHDLGSGGALTYAIAGVDCALWDLKGKLLGVPVHALIGGNLRNSVPAYGGFGISGGEVSVARAIKRAVSLAESGFKIIKLRVQIRENNLNPVDDPTIDYYKAIRDELPGDVKLFVDPNEGYTAYRAIEIGKALADLGMPYFEAPCPNEAMSDTRQVVEALDIPVLTGEKCYNRWMFNDLIEQANPDMINPDFAKSGGITEGLKICHLAQVHHKLVVPHNTKPMYASAATMQMLASIPNCGPMVEYIETTLYPGVCSIFDQGMEFKNGEMLLPKGDGLGLVINEKRAKKLFGY
jgi:L-alanine-DL-glutamate epimerase-like enolase superfamily enzyme